jgi:hypothetical protein
MGDSKALDNLRQGLGAVDDVLSFVKTSKGKPSKPEQSLFVASVGLSYAMWENYVEELAIEVTEFLASETKESDVPETVKTWIMKSSPSSWDIAVHPGWRALWREQVRTRATGGSGVDGDLGMNTASEKNVRSLFERVGVDPFAGVSKDHVKKLDKLVKERGQIVHTGKAPDDFRKKNATEWRSFVEDLGTSVDHAVADGAESVAAKSPW